MSEREKAIALIDTVPDYKLAVLIAYIQGLTADIDPEFNESTLNAIAERDRGEYETYSADVSTAEIFANILAE